MFGEFGDRLAIEALADAFRARYPQSGPPVVVEVLALKAGIGDITYSDRISGSALLIEGLQTKAVVLNRNDTRVRHRFSIAHEIGHMVVNPDRGAHLFRQPIAARSMSGVRMRVERACDFFAGCLLMPRSWMIVAVMELGVDEAAIARRFDVSPEAARYRLREVGYRTERR